MSQRAIICLISVLASGLALLGRFGGLFHGWDASLYATTHGLVAALPVWIEVVCVCLFALGTTLVGLQVTDSKYRLGLFAAILLQPFSATAVGALAGVWVSPFAWLVAILAALLGVIGYRYSRVGKRQRLLREVFGKHLSSSSLAQLLKRSDALQLKTVSATLLSARYLGKEWSQVEEMAQRLREQSAWVEVQTGNRLLAVWNLPLELGAAAEKAVEATLEMKKNWQVGVATGEITGECVATTNQWQMSGDGFEKADALCQANTTFGSHVLVDLATCYLVKETMVLRPVDFIVLPMTELGVEVFEPLALTKSASADTVNERDRFWEAVVLFRQKRFTEALAAFQKSGDDAVVKYYLQRLEKLTSAY